MLEGRARKGLPTPALDDRPELDSSLIPLWDCYAYLTTSRLAGEPILISEILAYFDLIGLNEETRLYWFEVIKRLDYKYLNLYTQDQERKRKERESVSQKPHSRNRRS